MGSLNSTAVDIFTPWKSASIRAFIPPRGLSQCPADADALVCPSDRCSLGPLRVGHGSQCRLLAGEGHDQLCYVERELCVFGFVPQETDPERELFMQEVSGECSRD